MEQKTGWHDTGDGRYGLQASGTELLELATLDPGLRSSALRRALGTINAALPAAGTALVRPSPDGVSTWRADYAGAREKEMERWLRPRLDASPEVIATTLGEASPCAPGTRPAVIPLHPSGPAAGGLWLVWPHADAKPTGQPGSLLAHAGMEGFRRALGSLVEVEHKERLYFRHATAPLDEELARALRGGDGEALPALLALARAVGGADLTYWGSVHDGVVDVECHLGAMDRGFGFELPLGQGIGGRAFACGETIEVDDYQNCRYRYPGVSDVTDGERVRSTLAIPLRSADPRSGAVLYAVRREVSPFSPAERALLSRLGRSAEPVPGLRSAPRRFFPSYEDRISEAKVELRRMLLDSKEAQDVESWLERLVKGPAILADRAGHPYVPANTDRFERLRNSSRHPKVVPLTVPGASGGRGDLYLWPSVELPLPGWPDLLEDASAVCNVVLDRAEQAHDRLDRARSHWLRGIAEGKAGPGTRREGNRLGLPVDRGEVWSVAWKPAKTRAGGEEIRRKMLAEDAVLDRLGSPLISFGDGVGILLLKEGARKERPACVRDDLLRFFGPAPLWLIHGAAYDADASPNALKEALLRTVRTAERVRDENSETYVSEVGGWGLDGLLENPKLSKDLDDFADNLLAPLILHDERTNSRLTETFCLVLTSSPDEAAKSLFVHANTIRYRMRRARQILDKDPDSPKERAAMCLAAFVRSRHHAGPTG